MLLSKAMVQHWTNQSPPLAVRGQRAIRGKHRRVQAHRMALGSPRVDCSRLGVEVCCRANTRKLLRDSRATGGYMRSSSSSRSSSGDDAWVSDSSRRGDDPNPEVGSSSGTAVPNSEGAPNATSGQHPDCAELPPPRHAYASWLAGRQYAERSTSGVGSARSSICAGG